MRAALVLVTQQASCQAEKMAVFFVMVKTVLFLRLLVLLSMQHIIILQPQLIMAATPRIITFRLMCPFICLDGQPSLLSEKCRSIRIADKLLMQIFLALLDINHGVTVVFGLRLKAGFSAWAMHLHQHTLIPVGMMMDYITL